MLEVSAYEAKTHLSKLLNKVGQGEHIKITKHKTLIAYLIPAGEYQRPNHDIFMAFKKFREGKKLMDGDSVSSLIKIGRK